MRFALILFSATFGLQTFAADLSSEVSGLYNCKESLIEVGNVQIKRYEQIVVIQGAAMGVMDFTAPNSIECANATNHSLKDDTASTVVQFCNENAMGLVVSAASGSSTSKGGVGIVFQINKSEKGITISYDVSSKTGDQEIETEKRELVCERVGN